MAAICQPPDSPAWPVRTLSKPVASYSSQHTGILAHHGGNGLGLVGHSLGSGPSPVSSFIQGALERAQERRAWH